MRLFLKRFHKNLYIFAAFFFFSLCFPFIYFLAKNPKKNYRKIVQLRKWFSVTSIHLVGIRFKVNYDTPIDWSRPYILCPNHSSILDITALNYVCPQPFTFMGKEELLKNPITRIFFKSVDIPVNRDSKISSFRAYKRASQLLQEGKSVVIFPEGKIDHVYPPILQKFKPGAFRMAIDNNIPILPIVIHNAWEIMWDDGKKFGSKPGTIYISVLSPIQADSIEKLHHHAVETEVFEKMNQIWKR